MPAGRISRRLGRLLAHPADPKLTTHHPNLLQILEYLLRHAFRQVDETMILTNVHPAYVHALDPRLVGDGTDDVAGLDSMYRPHFDAKSFHQTGGRFGARLVRGRRMGLGGGEIFGHPCVSGGRGFLAPLPTVPRVTRIPPFMLVASTTPGAGTRHIG